MVFLWILIACTLSTTESATDPLKAVKDVYDDYYKWRMTGAQEVDTFISFYTYSKNISQYSLTHMDFVKAKTDDFLKRLGRINVNQLPGPEQYNYHVLEDTLRTVSDGFIWREFSALNPINFLEGDQVDPGFILEVTTLKNLTDCEEMIDRMDDAPRQIEDAITLMRIAIRLTRTYHNVSMTKVPGQLADMIPAKATDFIFYRPFKTDLDKTDISDQDKSSLRQRALVSSIKYIAALRKLKDFIVEEYMAHSRGSYGVGGWDNGGLYYASCLKWHTTVDISPEKVHEIGLAEVKRISRKMSQIMRRQNFNGTIAEYFKMLSSDPRFHFKTGDEIIAKYKEIIYNRIYPALLKVFKNLPKYRVKVTKMANDGFPAQYQPGSIDGTRPGEIQANVYRPNETDSFSMVGLALHEAVPGHHFQFTKKQTSDLPEFRKEDLMGARYMVPYTFQGYSAYVEGWALYAEYLGEELGLYVDDYELMGRYSNEIVRACRLVVDTGLHYFGWSKERALQYFRLYSDWSGGNLENEVDRYITWPGQACAYKIGEMQIKDLRSKAEKTLGSKFNIKDFHEVILNAGPMPLVLLGSVVDNWILTTQRSSTHQGSTPQNTGQGMTASTDRHTTNGPVYTFTGQLPLIPNIG